MCCIFAVVYTQQSNDGNLLNLTASFSVMERRLTKLISDVSDIKEKQDSHQFSLSILNRSRAAEMEHQRELPSAEHPLRQPHRDPPSFSGPFVAPSTSSTPAERKPKAWYMTDSFTEQFSPPGSRFSFAQPSFKIGYPLPAVPPQQQQREALGQLLMPKNPSALASLQQQRRVSASHLCQIPQRRGSHYQICHLHHSSREILCNSDTSNG